jgi:hypothetical protein
MQYIDRGESRGYREMETRREGEILSEQEGESVV